MTARLPKTDVCSIPFVQDVSSVFPITERRDMGLYEMPMPMSLLGVMSPPPCFCSLCGGVVRYFCVF